MCDASGAASWIFDQMGRPTIEQRLLGSANKTIGYQYYLDGPPWRTWYPSGDYIYSKRTAAGREFGVQDSPIAFVSPNAMFYPNGALREFGQGSSVNYNFAGILTERAYNKRLQPFLEYSLVGGANPVQYLFRRCYDFHMKGGVSGSVGGVTCSFSGTTPGDNGNVYQITNQMDDNRTQNFTYDAFNRITSAYTNGTNWGETYTIDPWGNLTNRGPVSGKTNYEALSASPASVQNRLPGFGYDAAGNMTSNGSANYTYDAENRLVSTAGVTYTYDGDGKRVKKSNGTLYWTGVGSDTLSESDLSGTMNADYFYFNGMRVARVDRPSNTMHLYINDHLGTARIIATPSSYSTVTTAESDYYPYGGEIPISSSDPNHYKFTGKERDSESGLDYFVARYNFSNIGRFITPDEPFADQDAASPQSWNLYSYVRNNPTNNTDVDGHSHCVPTTTQDVLHCYSDKTWAAMVAEGQRKAGANLVWGLGQALSYVTPAGWMYHALGGAPLTEQPSNPGEAYGMRMTNAELGVMGLSAGFTVPEQAIAGLLEEEGNVVVAIDAVQNQKNADALVNGVKTEFKTVTVAGPNTLKNQIQDGLQQGQNVVIDARATSITKTEAVQQIKRVEGNIGSVAGRVTIYTKEGKVTH